MVAYDRGSDLCVEIVTRGLGGSICGPSPSDLRFETLTISSAGDGVRGVHGGAVPAGVARASLRFSRAEPREVSAETTAGEGYRGRAAGRVRFYLADGPSAEPWLRSYADAAGTVLEAESESDGPLTGPPFTLARGGAYRLRAVTRLSLAPTPLDRLRVVPVTCFSFVSWERGLCTTADEPMAGDVEVWPLGGCDRRRVAVVASRRARRVEVLLGDGRRVRVRLAIVPAAHAPPPRAGGLVLDGAIAMRRVEAFDVSGRRIQRRELRFPPPQPCRRGGHVEQGDLLGEEERAPGTGPLVARARDDDARLCFALGDFRADKTECHLPPIYVDEAILQVRRAGGRTLVAGLLPRVITAFDLRVDGVRRRFAATGDLPGYGGQYRDHVSFAAVELPGSPQVSDARFFDALGRQVYEQPLLERPEPRPGTRRTLRVGGMALRLVRLRAVPGVEHESACLALPGRSLQDCDTLSTDSPSITAVCSPRRLVVLMAAPAAARLVLRTPGRDRVARRIRVGREVVHIGVLPPRARLEGIALRRRSVRDVVKKLPPAAAQCGYDDYAHL